MNKIKPNMERMNIESSKKTFEFSLIEYLHKKVEGPFCLDCHIEEAAIESGSNFIQHLFVGVVISIFILILQQKYEFCLIALIFYALSSFGFLYCSRNRYYDHRWYIVLIEIGDMFVSVDSYFNIHNQQVYDLTELKNCIKLGIVAQLIDSISDILFNSFKLLFCKTNNSGPTKIVFIIVNIITSTICIVTINKLY